MTQVATASPLLAWLEAPRRDRTIRFARGDGGWDAYPYADLADLVAVAAARLANQAAGRPGTILALPNGAHFVAGFFGSLLAGLVPTAISPPSYFQSRDDYVDHVARLIRVARPAVLVGEQQLVPVLRQAVERSGEPPAVLDAAEMTAGGDGRTAPDAVRRTELATLQFTSGSSGVPRGVRITWDNLESNVAANAALVGYDGTQPAASWVPTYHDLGLVGGLLTPLRHQGELSMLRPEQFLFDPLRWLRCLGRDGAAIAAAPSFALGYAAARVRPGDLDGMDFSGVRAIVMGAERHDPRSLLAFTELCEPYGFSPTALVPCYGMAEATLGVTGHPPGSPASAVCLDPESLRLGGVVKLFDRGTLADVRRSDRPADWLVSSGRPLADTAVEIVDEAGALLPDGYLGEVLIRGAAVADGYEPAGAESASRFLADATVASADAGFLLDGELYVLGRMGDSVSIRGRNVYAEDLDARLAEVPGVPRGRCACLVEPEQVVVVAEADPGPWADEAAEVVSVALGGVVPVRVLSAPRGTIRRTSSGKPRRRLMWRDLKEGRLAGVVAADREARS